MEITLHTRCNSNTSWWTSYSSSWASNTRITYIRISPITLRDRWITCTFINIRCTGLTNLNIFFSSYVISRWAFRCRLLFRYRIYSTFTNTSSITFSTFTSIKIISRNTIRMSSSSTCCSSLYNILRWTCCTFLYYLTISWRISSIISRHTF